MFSEEATKSLNPINEESSHVYEYIPNEDQVRQVRLDHSILLFKKIQPTVLQFNFLVGATMLLLPMFSLQLHWMTKSRLINFKGASLDLFSLGCNWSKV